MGAYSLENITYLSGPNQHSPPLNKQLNHNSFTRNKITSDHNLLLVYMLIQNNHKGRKKKQNKTLGTYDSCINFTKSTDQRFIHPPIVAPDLTLSIKECNLNEGITFNTIQYQGTKNPTYLTKTLHHMASFLQPSPQDLATKITWLL